MYEKKKGKKRETYTQALRKVKCAYTKKSDLSLEVNTARDFNDSWRNTTVYSVRGLGKVNK